MADYRKTTIDELAEHLLFLKKQNISATILLGAGVSASTGIPLANQMVKIIQEAYPQTTKTVKDGSYAEYMKILPEGTRKEFIKKYTANPKLNLAHLYLSSFIKHGYIDRILTTNFDPLIIKSLALNNIFPSVYDLAESKDFDSDNVVDPSVFYIHGRYNGYYVLNTTKEVSLHSKITRKLFADTAKNRCWIVIGYSGVNDPLYSLLTKIKRYRHGLYWVGYKDTPPSPSLLNGILKNESASYIEGYDADHFFMKLAGKMNLEKPEILNKPLELIKDVVLSIVDIEKDKEPVGITDKILNELDQYIDLSKNIIESEASHLTRRTRDLWIYEKYGEIDLLYAQVKESKNNAAKKFLSYAIKRYILELQQKNSSTGDIERLSALLDDLSEDVFENENDTDNVFLPKSKEYIDPVRYPAFYNGRIAVSGMLEARNLLKTDKIELIGKRVFEKDLMDSYIYWVFVKKEDFQSIRKEFSDDKSLNIIGEIIKRKKYDLSANKSHYFIPTIVGDEAGLFHMPRETPALLHLQITYKQVNNGRHMEPIELLIGKHLGEINVAGFISDAKSHEQNYYSKMIDNYLPAEDKSDFLEINKKMYYPFYKFVKNFKKEYVIPENLIRIPLVSDSSCNYQCVFCCYGDKHRKHDRLITEKELSRVLKAALVAGYKKVMFTGGEPLMLEKKYLLPLVKTAVAIIGEEKFWITSNGSLLTPGLADHLFDCGLRRLCISVPAPREKYRECVNPKSVSFQHPFDLVLGNVAYAVSIGMRIRIDIPLNTKGAKDMEDIEQIIDAFKTAGVRDFIYFPLHKTKENAGEFETLYVDPYPVSIQFNTSDKWRIWNDPVNRMSYFINKENIRISIASDAYPVTENCKKLKCGHYCQGTYAAYLLADHKSLYLRACHREFKDNRNVFRIEAGTLRDDQKLISTLKEVIKYANSE